MNSLNPRLVIFGLFCLIQLSVPAFMIGKREAALRMGTPYRFLTAPVDPHDPFRGRYVALDFREDAVDASGLEVEDGARIFVQVYESDNGFARLGEVSLKPPDHGDYIKMRAGYGTSGGRMRVDLPFDRYYMNEKKAPEAERVYMSATRSAESNTFALVKILDGMAVIEGLYIDGVHVLDYLANAGK